MAEHFEKEVEKKFYETPQVSVVNVEVEKMCATSGDPTITNPDMGWGAREIELPSEERKFKSVWD